MVKTAVQKFKLLILYCILAIIPVIAIFFYFYQNIYNRMEKELLTALNQSLARVAETIDKDINQVSYLSDKIYGNKQLYDILEKDYDTPVQYFENYTQIIMPIMMAMNPIDTRVKYYCIYVDNPTIFGGGYIQRLDASFTDNSWMNYIQDSKAIIYVYGRYYPHTQSGMLFSFLRNMNQYKNSNQFDKIIKIDLEPDFFRIDISDNDFKGIINIVDEKQTIVCSTFPELEWTQYEDNSKDDRYRQYIPINTLVDWQVIGIADVDYIKNSLNTQRNIALILLALSTVFIVGVVYRLVNVIFASKLRETQITLQKKQAELNSLRNQVDPHFLFNVLETVRMKLLLSDQKEHSNVIMRMAKLYRKLLTWKDDIVPLMEEAEFIREFMFIQDYRYEDGLVWTMKMNDSAKDFKVPKMLFHSFIENACKHGMNENGGETRIDIEIDMQGNNLRFRVSDNGCGFPPEESENFYAMLDGKFDALKGIGINNAIQRLLLYYGDRFRLTLETKEGQGAAIEIVLPPMEADR